MTKLEAREYVNKRWTELSGTPENKINVLLQELNRQGFGVYLHDNMPYIIKGVNINQEGVTYHV